MGRMGGRTPESDALKLLCMVITIYTLARGRQTSGGSLIQLNALGQCDHVDRDCGPAYDPRGLTFDLYPHAYWSLV